MRKSLLLCFVAIVAVATLCPVSVAVATTFDPTIDTWIRESNPDTSYDNDRICVWASPDASGDNRHAILQFDVSGMTEPITNAYLDLYLTSYWRNSTAAAQVAELITTPLTSGNISWNDIYGGSYTGIAMETFGYYNQYEGTRTDQYCASGIASAADLAAINAQKNATGTLTFLLKPAEAQIIGTEVIQQGRHDWGDNLITTPESVPATPALLFNGRTSWAEATTDIWVSEARDDDPAWTNDGIFENDWISVWHNERESDAVGDGQRVGVVEFDLSSITSSITSAEMALFSLGDASGVRDEKFVQEAYLLELAPGVTFANLDWTTLNDPAKVTEVMQFETLGGYNLPGGTANQASYDSWLFSNASTVDVNKLEEIRLAGGKAVIAFRSVPQDVEVPVYDDVPTGQREWADTGYDAGNPAVWPHLVLNEELLPPPNREFDVPAVAPITVDGDISDWGDSTAWSEEFVVWNTADGDTPMSSTTKAKFAWNDATDMLYIAVQTDQANGGHLAIGVGTEETSVPTSSVGSTQLAFDAGSGTDVTIMNEIQYYKDTYSLTEWADGGTDGVLAKQTNDGTTWTYEIAIPFWSDWATMLTQETLSEDDVNYVYLIMENMLEGGTGTDMTFEGNPHFSDGTFEVGAALTFVGSAKIAGDANNDGKVDGSDVTILAGNWQKGVDDGQTASWEEGDFNGDGKVDGSDVTILAGNWQAGVTTAAASVPEPSTVILLLSALAGVMFIRRK